MSKNNLIKFLISTTFFILAFLFAITKNNIFLSVNNYEEEIIVLTSYKEDDVLCREGNILNGYHKCKYETIGTIDTSKIGNYEITYKYKDKKTTKTVKVIDNIAPEITLDEQSLKICPQKYDNINILYKANDNYDGDITNKVTLTQQKNQINLTVKDSSNNETTITKNLIEEDLIAPEIILKGANPYHMLTGTNYEENGYEIKDNCDNNISNKVTINNNINTNEEGTYEITYTAKDESGNTTTKKRTVIITKDNNISITPEEKTIYLTFDDGPGKYTDELLDILKKYNIKATFFVTNQFPKYIGCIKKAYDDGHAIALHTYSHLWTIYKSVDSYFDDLNKISNIVKEQIGKDIKLIRFPGGSSNTVSRKQNVGIMSTLTKEVKARGYIYFDWNIDSGDTKTTDSFVVVSNVIKSLEKNNIVNVILLHDIKKHTVEAVPSIIEYGLKQGFKFEILTETSPTVQNKINN